MSSVYSEEMIRVVGEIAARYRRTYEELVLTKGEEWRFVAEIIELNDRQRAETLAAAIRVAEAHGKERFDFGRQEGMCDTSTPDGDVEPDVEKRCSRLEYRYYVLSSSMNVAQFAQEVETFRTSPQT